MFSECERKISRRAAAGAVALTIGAFQAAVAGPCVLARAPDDLAWLSFKRRFLQQDGRIVDSGNSGISHSEGQAIGMFLAVRHADQAAFRQISGWTMRHLAIRPDALLAWRYQPSAFGGLVRDQNNASDADLYHAWALHEAAAQWPEGGYGERARRVARDILSLNVRRIGGYTVLLPGAWGFDRQAFIELNPSYFHFRALKVMQEILPNPAWGQVASFGELLLEQGLFGQAQLPADWVLMDPRSGRFMAAQSRPHRFGFDAVRVPLHLAWGGRTEHVAFRSVGRFWSRLGPARTPAWVNLESGQHSTIPAGAGVQAISALMFDGRGVSGINLAQTIIGAESQYYDACLSLLAREATRDTSVSLLARSCNSSIIKNNVGENG